MALMRNIPGIQDLGVFHVPGQPGLNVAVDRQAALRYQINASDVPDAIQTAVGGNALTQVLKGEARYDLVMRYRPRFRDTKEAIKKLANKSSCRGEGMTSLLAEDISCQNSRKSGIKRQAAPMLAVKPQPILPKSRARRWGVILASGSGTRLVL